MCDNLYNCLRLKLLLCNFNVEWGHYYSEVFEDPASPLQDGALSSAVSDVGGSSSIHFATPIPSPSVTS